MVPGAEAGAAEDGLTPPPRAALAGAAVSWSPLLGFVSSSGSPQQAPSVPQCGRRWLTCTACIRVPPSEGCSSPGASLGVGGVVVCPEEIQQIGIARLYRVVLHLSKREENEEEEEEEEQEEKQEEKEEEDHLDYFCVVSHGPGIR